MLGLCDLNDELKRLAAGSKLIDEGQTKAARPNASKNMEAKEEINSKLPVIVKKERRPTCKGKSESKMTNKKGSKGDKKEKVKTEQINSCTPEPMTAKEKR